MRTRVVAGLLTTLWFTLQCAHAQKSIWKEIDRRDAQQDAAETARLNRYVDNLVLDKRWIIFAANPAFAKADAEHFSLTGHIYVIFATESENTKSSTIVSYGFYPADSSGKTAVRSLFENVPGSLEDNLDKKHAGALNYDQTDLFLVRVSERDYSNAVSALGLWGKFEQDPPRAENGYVITTSSLHYNVPNSDCVTFADSIAGSIGLFRPSSKMFPRDYLHALESMNASATPNPADQRFRYTYSTPYGLDFDGMVDRNGTPDGFGRITVPGHYVFHGGFHGGQAEGPGEMDYSNGTKLNGIYSGRNVENAIFTEASGAKHSVVVQADGKIVEPAKPGAGNGGNGGGGSSGGGHDHGQVERAPKVESDHWSINGRDMGPTKMGDITPSR